MKERSKNFLRWFTQFVMLATANLSSILKQNPKHELAVEIDQKLKR